LQNAEFDEFQPERYRFAGDKILWDRTLITLQPADKWLLSKLQETIEEYTLKLERCEFNVGMAVLENFVIETLSRLYVPMIRKELWTDEPETFERRQTIYAILHYTLKIVTLLFNPVTPYLSEALYQKVYKKFDPKLPASINFECWPEPDAKMRNKSLEEEFDVLFGTVSLVYAARQQAKLKRRWPLARVIAVTSEKASKALKKHEQLFLDLINVKAAGYESQVPEYCGDENWVSATEGDVQVLISGKRDDKLLGEGIMRDLARRVQALRKDLGFVPTDVLDAVHIAELDEESRGLLQSYLEDMAELVRTKRVYLHSNRSDLKAEWHESKLDGKRIYINIH